MRILPTTKRLMNAQQKLDAKRKSKGFAEIAVNLFLMVIRYVLIVY